jgi:hypothetical protein
MAALISENSPIIQVMSHFIAKGIWMSSSYWQSGISLIAWDTLIWLKDMLPTIKRELTSCSIKKELKRSLKLSSRMAKALK